LAAIKPRRRRTGAAGGGYWAGTKSGRTWKTAKPLPTTSPLSSNEISPSGVSTETLLRADTTWPLSTEPASSTAAFRASTAA